MRSRCVLGHSHPVDRPRGNPGRTVYTGAQSLRQTERDGIERRGPVGAGAAEIVRLVPDLQEHVPSVTALPLADDVGARFRLFDSVVKYLRASAAARPLVLILEDLHWAQPASVDLLRFLIDDMQEARICVIATYRDVEVSAPHALPKVLQAPSYPPQAQRIALAGLSEQEIKQLIAALGHAGAAALAARIHRASGGNPFFASEIARGLGTAAGAIPGSVRDAIHHRLLRLSDPCQRLLGIAAVIGAELGVRAGRTTTTGGNPWISVTKSGPFRIHGVVFDGKKNGIRPRFLRVNMRVPDRLDRPMMSSASRLALHPSSCCRLAAISPPDRARAGGCGRRSRCCP